MMVTVELDWRAAAYMFADGDNIVVDGRIEAPGHGPTVHWLFTPHRFGSTIVQVQSGNGFVHGCVRVGPPINVCRFNQIVPGTTRVVSIDTDMAGNPVVDLWDGDSWRRLRDDANDEIGEQPVESGMLAYPIIRHPADGDMSVMS